MVILFQIETESNMEDYQQLLILCILRHQGDDQNVELWDIDADWLTVSLKFSLVMKILLLGLFCVIPLEAVVFVSDSCDNVSAEPQ